MPASRRPSERGPDRWARDRRLPWRRSFDTTLVLSGGAVTELRGAARALWELADEPTTTHDAVRALAALFHQAPDALAGEAAAAVDDLAARGLLVDVADAGPRQTLRPRPRRPLVVEHEPDGPLEQIAAWGLEASPVPIDRGAWETLLGAIGDDRLTGLAFAAATDAPPPGAVASRLARLHRDAMTGTLLVERTMAAVVGAAHVAGVAPVLHKGPALAHAAYDDPAHRPFGDVDLLVPPAELDRFYAVLTELGFRRRYPEPRPGFDRRFGKGAAFTDAAGVDVDVHRSFAAGPFGLRVDVDEVHERATEVVVAGARVRVMALEHQLLAVAMHAVLGDRHARILNLRDVVQLLAATELDVDAAVAAARHWRVDAPLAVAIREAAATFGVSPAEPLVDWARRHVPSASDEGALRAYRDPGRSYATQSVAALRSIPRLRDRAAYLRAMLLPRRSYLDGRDAGHLQRWRRIIRAAVGR